MSIIKAKSSCEYLPYTSLTIPVLLQNKERVLHFLILNNLFRERKNLQIQMKIEMLLPYFCSPKSCLFILNVSLTPQDPHRHWSILNIKHLTDLLYPETLNISRNVMKIWVIIKGFINTESTTWGFFVTTSSCSSI